MRSEADIIRNIRYLQARETWNKAYRERKKRQEVNSIKVKKHGHIESYITGDRILVTVKIHTDEYMAIAHNMLLDTGSNCTVISPDVCCVLNNATDMSVIGAHTNTNASQITGRIVIEDEIEIDEQDILIIGLDAFNGTGIHGVIGMDIIQAGDLHVFRKDEFPHFEFTL